MIYQSPTGSTELRAMYGGLQIALGAFAALAALRSSLARPALLAIAFLTAGLAERQAGRRGSRRRHLVVHGDGARFRARLGVDRGVAAAPNAGRGADFDGASDVVVEGIVPDAPREGPPQRVPIEEGFFTIPAAPASRRDCSARCRACGELFFPRRTVCAKCLAIGTDDARARTARQALDLDLVPPPALRFAAQRRRLRRRPGRSARGTARAVRARRSAAATSRSAWSWCWTSRRSARRGRRARS